MNDTITIAVIPLDIAQADKEANLRNVVTLMQSVDPATDVVVLPELFSTGFIADPQEMRDMSETNTGNTIDTMQPACRPATTWRYVDHSLPKPAVRTTTVHFSSNRRATRHFSTKGICSP